MHKLVITLIVTVAVLAGRQAVAAPETELMAPVRQFINGVNKGDTKMAQAACADQTLIIDDFPPYTWHGAGATTKWFHGFKAYASRNGLTDPAVTLDKAQHMEAAGGTAYVVVPAHFSFKLKGKPTREGGTLTIVLRKGTGGWRIAAWCWADN